jgi:hypothetical protein
MNLDNLNEKECKGLIFRSYSSVFKYKSGHFEHRQGFRLLKRSSCPGCSNCGGLLDYANECLTEGEWLHYRHLDDNSTYRLTADCDGEFKFTKVK